MALSPGTILGSYEVVSLLGAGGMGEVYRARDTRLGRSVAIKVLPEALASDAERVARLEREAKVLASLNHPHIAALHGFETAGDRPFLVMELVEGETLAERLVRGPLKVDDALRIAIQICEALETAHEQGIVHRDLKPANIKLTPDDKVKVLDFGLARAMESAPAVAGAGLTHSPTLSLMATQAGMILGTAAYMSPEQAKGLPADHRSDVFSFGCVLYEMLTGRQAFQGDSAPEILAAVLMRDPDLAAVSRHLNPRLVEVLERCLDKDRRRRYHAISDTRVELERIAVQTPQDRARPRRISRPAVAAVAAGLVAAATLPVALVHWREPSADPSAMVFELPLPPGMSLTQGGGAIPRLEISPNGRHVVFRADNKLWLRSLHSPELRPLAGTENASIDVFWSPDSESIAFASDGALKRTAIRGGVQTIARLPWETGAFRGGDWNQDGVILLGAPAGTATTLTRVAAAGGELTPALATERDVVQVFPSFLGDGRHFVFVQLSADARFRGLYVGDLASGSTMRIGDDLSQIRTAGDWLFAVRNGSLTVQRFDRDRSVLLGSAATIAENVAAVPGGGRTGFSVSDSGSVVLMTGTFGLSQFTWVTRNGSPAGTVGEPVRVQTMALSPDGTRLVYGRREGENQGQSLWVIDLVRAVTTRLTFGPSLDTDGTWAPDMSSIVFASNRTGEGKSLFEVPAAGGVARPLLSGEGGAAISPDDWSADGKVILYHGDATRQLFALPRDPGQKPRLVLNPQNGIVDESVFSPDGKWIAYNADESGRHEVYVTPFPPTGARWQVSSQGGVQPQWNRNGKELFFLAPAAGAGRPTMMAVDVRLGTPPTIGVARALFEADIMFSATVDTFAATPDGQRFLVMQPVRGQSEPPPRIILNWPALVNADSLVN